jgi:hypothetical protein
MQACLQTLNRMETYQTKQEPYGVQAFLAFYSSVTCEGDTYNDACISANLDQNHTNGQLPQVTMILDCHRDGNSRLRRRLDGASARMYGILIVSCK